MLRKLVIALALCASSSALQIGAPAVRAQGGRAGGRMGGRQYGINGGRHDGWGEGQNMASGKGGWKGAKGSATDGVMCVARERLME